MRKGIVLFFLVYYLLGNILLPMGNFSQLEDLSEMYKNCKETEDKDMTAFDFVTDHLIDLDCLFDKHDEGDEQKPHKPMQSHHVIHFFQIVQKQIAFELKAPVEYVDLSTPTGAYYSNYSFQTISSIFHPPAVI